MSQSTSPNRLRAYCLVVALFCLLMHPSARSTAQAVIGDQYRAASGDSTTPQYAEPVCEDSVPTWVGRAQRVGRDLGLRVAPATVLIATLGVGSASALAIYYDTERPYPTTCRPPAPDKWQHCYVGCRIAKWCPIGSLSASILAVLKEVRDSMSYGDFSWPDVLATLGGAWGCECQESCEACCCEEVGAVSITIIRERQVTAGCATCIFEMKGVTGCKLAVEIDGRHYLVADSGIEDEFVGDFDWLTHTYRVAFCYRGVKQTGFRRSCRLATPGKGGYDGKPKMEVIREKAKDKPSGTRQSSIGPAH